MENIFKELAEIETCQDEINKIEALNDTLKQISDEVKKQNNEHLKAITNIFNKKLKSNPNYNQVVNNFIEKYVENDVNKKSEAREELFLILTGEVLSIFKGITQTKFC